MANKDRKIPVNMTLTARQIDALKREGKRLSISPSDVLRRLVDEWYDRRPTLASTIYKER